MSCCLEQLFNNCWKQNLNFNSNIHFATLNSVPLDGRLTGHPLDRILTLSVPSLGQVREASEISKPSNITKSSQEEGQFAVSRFSFLSPPSGRNTCLPSPEISLLQPPTIYIYIYIYIHTHTLDLHCVHYTIHYVTSRREVYRKIFHLSTILRIMKEWGQILISCVICDKFSSRYNKSLKIFTYKIAFSQQIEGTAFV